MKIVSWNCNMAFRKKHAEILEYKPDLLIIIECEEKEKLIAELKDIDFKEILWYGDNPHKGIALIRFGDFKIKLHKSYNPEFRYVLPFVLEADRKVNLFVIWAMPHESIRQRSYVGQIWAAVHHYEKLLKKDSLLIGDFNSNTIWDHTRKNGHHKDLVDFLAAKDIHSLYHKKYGEAHGGESLPTQFLYRHQDKPYHLDYCFASKSFIGKRTDIEIGKYDDWIGLSDHMPISVSNLEIGNWEEKRDA